MPNCRRSSSAALLAALVPLLLAVETVAQSPATFAPAEDVFEAWVAKPGAMAGVAIQLDEAGNSYSLGNGSGMRLVKHDAAGHELFNVGLPKRDYFGVQMLMDGAGDLVVLARRYLLSRVVMLKFDREGRLRWEQQQPDLYHGRRMALGDQGQAYVITSHYTNSLLRYEADGSLTWSRITGGYGFSPVALEVDSRGHVVVTGTLLSEVWTMSFDAHGELLWLSTFAHSVGAVARWVATGPSNEVYVAADVASPTGLGTDLALVKYSSGGAQRWVRYYDGPGNYVDHAVRVAVNSQGHATLVGQSQGASASFESAVLQFDGSGQLLWETRHLSGFGETPTNLLIGPDDAIYVTATGQTAENNWMTFKLGPAGRLLWEQGYAGSSPSSADTPNRMSLGRRNELYVTGDSPFTTIKYVQRPEI